MVASIASVAALLGSLAFALWLLRHDADRGEQLWPARMSSVATPSEPVACETAEPGRQTLRGQLLFIEPLESGFIALDCLLTDSTVEDDAEQPVHVVAALPDTPWLASLAQKRLRQWLQFGDPVEVEVSSGRAVPPRVRVSCERTAFMLAVQTA